MLRRSSRCHATRSRRARQHPNRRERPFRTMPPMQQFAAVPSTPSCPVRDSTQDLLYNQERDSADFSDKNKEAQGRKLLFTFFLVNVWRKYNYYCCRAAGRFGGSRSQAARTSRPVERPASHLL